MIDIPGKEVLISTFTRVMESIILKKIDEVWPSDAKREKLVNAITAINQAIIETRQFIRQEGYKSNAALVTLWHIALDKSIAAGLKEGLPNYLYQKANFWGNPEEWIQYPGAIEIVPKLEDLKHLCDSLMVKLQK